MLLSRYRFSRLLRSLRQYRRPLLQIIALLFVIDALCLIADRPQTVRTPLLPRTTSGVSKKHDASANTTIFIASVHRNTEGILKSAWNKAVLDLVDFLGPPNVHIVALESGSQDQTKEALTQLKEQLDARHVSNTVVLGMTVWEQLEELDARPDPQAPRKEGWIWNKEDSHYDMRRIPYLARVRNQAMEPLAALQKEGRTFDKVLWLNDVAFDTEDFLTLLHTRDGSYAAACSMDFKEYPLYYDTFALRDEQGQKAVSLYWPWFLSLEARRATKRGEPVRVKSCWNGMVLFDAAPFYADPPLKFRGLPDSLADLHLEASECCLIHADNALSTEQEKGVWLNPNVRVGYNEEAYQDIRGHKFPGVAATVTGAWINRWQRWRGSVQQTLEQIPVQTRLAQWRESVPDGGLPRIEPGDFCIINEMQIMWQNGWKHL